MVEVEAPFIVAVLSHAAEGQFRLRIGPTASGITRADDYQEAASIRVDAASLALYCPIAATVAPEGAGRRVEGGQQGLKVSAFVQHVMPFGGEGEGRPAARNA
jgi:hypothetical protein